jgi:hypothetical protein
MSGKLKLSGVQGRKRKAKEEEEAKKLRKTLAAFMTVKRRPTENEDENSEPLMPMSTTAAEEKDELESESIHSTYSDNDSEENQTVNKAAESSVEDDHLVLVHKLSNSNTNNEIIMKMNKQ